MSTRSVSISSILQYAVLGVFGYFLTGAPLLSLITGSASDNGAAKSNIRRPPPLSHDKAAGLVIPERNLSCPAHTYTGVHVLNREPLVLYVEGFLGQDEVEHVIDVR